MEGSPSVSLKSLQSDVGTGILSPGMFLLLLLLGAGGVCLLLAGMVVFLVNFVLSWIGLVFQKGKKKACFTEVIVKLKIGACRHSEII